MATGQPRPNSYRTIWRWHFYAGLFVLPFIITLSLSGALYLFKPQIERWEERDFRGSPVATQGAPSRQVEAAMAAFPGAHLLDYRLPERAGDAAMVRLDLPDGGGVRETFVAADGAVVGSLRPEARIMALVKTVHSQLMIGKAGNWLVELAASWAILMIASGLYLWWPRGQGMAGVLWPRLTGGRRLFWRDLHAVTGFWISGLALVLLLTGLPWTDVWGSGFNRLRAELGWVKGASPWVTEEGAAEERQPIAAAEPHAPHHDGHSGVGHMGGDDGAFSPTLFDAMVARARSERLAFPAIVTPPGAPGRFGAPGEMAWTIRSDAANVPLQQTIRFSRDGSEQLYRERFGDIHVIDRMVGYGIAWHQGQLFGPLNQAIGVLTAAGLITLAVSGFMMWRRRKPAGRLGAPSAAERPGRVVVTILLASAALLPLLALSLLLIWLVERLAFPRLPRLARWLGAA
ncbi:conserved hypothetical protein [Sphingobium sp. SYK-6]|uniref:PepSY-associated TM helix domain-containing protein n=1 Tax=Sphingobium sp. (strain NBRC 103272 / SYK-6) TaxID=627192 RepID=UPI0002277117|nr:PepSY domain-containing protein [Sphingobium sp. SYK-6]BAK66374.1 conserved hypothetical protein [Sphingobium sp. SYK-6]